MSRIIWDQSGDRYYETGVKNCVLYTKTGLNGAYVDGVAWNGITAITESPSGAEVTALYADDTKYVNLISNEEFGCTIEAYTYPDEFGVCDGSAALATGVKIGQQARKEFGLCYRTTIGNDTEGSSKGYILHIVYGCAASPSEKAYSTVNDSPEAITFSWEVKTTPVNATGFNPTSHIEINSTKIQSAAKLAALEAALYGVDASEFSQAKTYAIGDYCTHADGGTTKYYVCSTAITTPAAWDASKWTEITNPGPHILLPDEVAAIMA